MSRSFILCEYSNFQVKRQISEARGLMESGVVKF